MVIGDKPLLLGKGESHLPVKTTINFKENSKATTTSRLGEPPKSRQKLEKSLRLGKKRH